MRAIDARLERFAIIQSHFFFLSRVPGKDVAKRQVGTFSRGEKEVSSYDRNRCRAVPVLVKSPL